MGKGARARAARKSTAKSWAEEAAAEAERRATPATVEEAEALRKAAADLGMPLSDEEARGLHSEGWQPLG